MVVRAGAEAGEEAKGRRGPEPHLPSLPPDAFPYQGEIRIVHEDYSRLRTGWWAVSLASPEEWGQKVQQMHEAFQTHFGNYTTEDGTVVPRWNARTWERVRRRLRVERR